MLCPDITLAILSAIHICESPFLPPSLSPSLPSGGVSEHETLGNVECFDPETDCWVVDVIPQMRYRRSGVGVAVLQGLLFAIGRYLEGKTSTDAVCNFSIGTHFMIQKLCSVISKSRDISSCRVP